MASFLSNLISNLSKDQLNQTKKGFKEKIYLISRKGVYPYEYMDKIEKFDETKLPNRKEFHSKLNESHISDKDYKHVNKT